jgi:hypothetical protein
MPVSVARKIQFFLDRDGDDLDIRLYQIALNADQVAEFSLPKIPIKDSDKRRASFESVNGEGAVELDALVALHPGALEQIIETAIHRCRAPKRQADRAIIRIAGNIHNEIRQAREAAIAQHEDEITDLQAGFEAVQSEIAAHQSAITDALDACRRTVEEHEDAIQQQLAQWSEDAAPVWQDIANDIAVPDVDAIQWPQAEHVEDDALFDSRRTYLEQIERFKRHQGKSTPGGES